MLCCRSGVCLRPPLPVRPPVLLPRLLSVATATVGDRPPLVGVTNQNVRVWDFISLIYFFNFFLYLILRCWMGAQMSSRVHVSAREPCSHHPAISVKTVLRSGAGLTTRAFILKSALAYPRNKIDRRLLIGLYKYHDTLKSASSLSTRRQQSRELKKTTEEIDEMHHQRCILTQSRRVGVHVRCRCCCWEV